MITKPFNRVITIMFENQYRSYVMQNAFMKKLASAGADMTNYFGAFHPSQTNYIASLAGEVCGVTNDTPPASPLLQETLVDLLEAKNVSWKAYMEAYPGDPWNKAWVDPDYNTKKTANPPIDEFPSSDATELARYFRKHNAFASFHTIQKEESRWNKIVSDTQFWKDVHDKTLPEYSWFTPDIWNDGHYLYNTHVDTNPRTQLVPQLSAWLEHVFLGNIETSKVQGYGGVTDFDHLGLNLDIDLLLTDPDKAWAQSHVPEGTLLVITFDEADFNAKPGDYDTNYDGPNQIYTVLLGDMITPGTVIDTPYNHYNLIRTVEENFQLGSLNKNDFGANWFRFLWEESFSWSIPTDTDFSAAKTLAITNASYGKHMVFANANGQLFESINSNSSWGQPKPLPLTSNGAIAMASIEDTSILILTDSIGDLLMSTYNPTTKQWSPTSTLNQKASGSFAVTSYYDMADAKHKFMLCWTTPDGFIQSMVGNTHGFSGTVVPVNQLTDGPITLGQLGASLFIVYKERNTRKMRMTSYNTGPFNAFKGKTFSDGPAPENNTSLHQWSVTDFPVGHFSKKMAALGNEYQSLGSMAMATTSGEMHLVHRGGYADISNAFTEVFGLTGIYSADNQLTNGFGTLNQAGWTLEQELNGVALNVDTPMAMCSNNNTIVLVWIDPTTKTIQYKQGGYACG